MMDRQQLKQELSEGLVRVEFTKKSTGEVRVMLCTTNATIIPKEHHPKTPIHEAVELSETAVDIPVMDPDLFNVFDVHKNGWRSFRYESILRIEELPMAT